MKTVVRVALILFAFAMAMMAGALYPVLARGEAWSAAKWTQWWWLLLIPLAPVAVWLMTFAFEERVPRLTIPTVAPFVVGPRGWRVRVRDLPAALRGAALVFGFAALARPQNVLKADVSEERGIDIVIVLDLSGSMAAVMDAPAAVTGPTSKNKVRPTRIDTAKDVIVDFVSRRKTDRIGVVVFAKAAFVLSPPTLDYTLLNQLVTRITLEDVDGSGTAIGDAVGTAVARLRRSNAKSKAVILLTDGDSNAGSVDPEYAAHLAKTQGVKVYTVQIGNGDDVDVPVAPDIFGQPRYVKRHYPVNPALLEKIAGETGGESFIATDKKGLEGSMHNILDHLEKSRIVAQTSSREDLFPYLLFPAVGLIALEALVRLFVVRRFP